VVNQRFGMKASIVCDAEGHVPMPNQRTLRPIFIMSLVVAVTIPTADAQRPDRPQEVRVPGSSLKAGWQLLFHDGCRFAVPSSWREDADGGQALAPDGSNLSVRMFRISSWSAHKAQIRAVFGHVSVLHEDSERRLWFEIGDKERTQHYIDVVNGRRACVGLLEIRATILSAEDANRIADSIGPAPDK
jgi:hypothetical protein